MIATKKRLTNVLIFMFVFRASILLAQQQPAMVVFDANAFYVANPSSLNTTPLIETVPEPSTKIAENSVTTHTQPLKKRIKKAISTPKASTIQKAERSIAQKTTVACPFGNYPSNSNSFYALHNGVAITPSVKTSPLTPLQRRGELTLCVEFILLEAEKPIFFYTNTQILQSKYIGQITTRPPPYNS